MSSLTSLIRFTLDDPARFALTPMQSSNASRWYSQGLSQHVRVTARVVPSLFYATRTAADRLGIDSEVSVFVFADPHINAYACHDTPTARIVLFVSSSLITSLSAEEWVFVLGHELGHYLLAHHKYPDSDPRMPNLRALELMRAAEISADRAGLIACDDTDICLSAMLKTTSGLSEEHLDINLGDYIRQLSELRDSAGDDGFFYSTHPPFPVRVRAVLRCDTLLREIHAGGDGLAMLPSIDADICRDLRSCEGHQQRQAFGGIADSAAFWNAALAMCRDGTFSTIEQATLAREFGSERLASLKGALGATGSMASSIAFIEEKAKRAIEELNRTPTCVEEEYTRILNRLSQ